MCKQHSVKMLKSPLSFKILYIKNSIGYFEYIFYSFVLDKMLYAVLVFGLVLFGLIGHLTGKREVLSSSRPQQMLNNSSQNARIFFPFSIVCTKWACDPENINIHYGVGAPGDVIVEPTLATGALSSRVRHSSRAAHKLNYLNIRTTFDV